MRKVLGANRSTLIRQYLIESFLLVFFALILALFLVVILALPLSNVLDSELTINILNPSLIIGLLIFATIIGSLSGFYPAFYLSRFNVVSIFSGTSRHGSRNRVLQIILVVIQFSIAIFLIISLIVLRGQSGCDTEE